MKFSEMFDTLELAESTAKKISVAANEKKKPLKSAMSPSTTDNSSTADSSSNAKRFSNVESPSNTNAASSLIGKSVSAVEISKVDKIFSVVDNVSIAGNFSIAGKPKIRSVEKYEEFDIWLLKGKNMELYVSAFFIVDASRKSSVYLVSFLAKSFARFSISE